MPPELPPGRMGRGVTEGQVTGDWRLSPRQTLRCSPTEVQTDLDLQQREVPPSGDRRSPQQPDDAPLDLLVAHKHHDVPGAQAEIRGHESTKRETGRGLDSNPGGSAASVLIGTHAVPLVEGGGTLFKQHGHGAVEGAAVLARHWVHVARFHHVHRGGHQGGAEPGGEGGGEVAGHVVCGEQTYMISIRRLKKKTKKKQHLEYWEIYASARLSLACASGWALWWCHRSRVQSSSRWSCERCLADNLENATKHKVNPRWHFCKCTYVIIYVICRYSFFEPH